MQARVVIFTGDKTEPHYYNTVAGAQTFQGLLTDARILVDEALETMGDNYEVRAIEILVTR